MTSISSSIAIISVRQGVQNGQDILLEVILFVYRTLLALSLALSFQLACVRLEENTTLFTV